MSKYLHTAQDMQLTCNGQGWSVVANNPAMTSVVENLATTSRFV
ncbi:hypothetical protein [Reinekea blandensis]|uniref:Uncharacterized protein n=1 Tax=Reinekea blandensis MED297 TaxID=314283 RepID=A4B913_9GAMM|nr:hypothetical protein [Reinekea blandensis]EAR11114.1 hypothetical protein MED297_19542 [Reinekea sp. MED297] [Reinekea blandensis MED297]